MTLEIAHCRAQSCTHSGSWHGQGALAVPALPHRHRAACSTHSSFLLWGCSQEPRAALRAICHPRDPALPALCPPVILSALLRLHISPFCENNKKPQKEAMKKPFPWLQEEPCVNRSSRYVNSRLCTQCLFFISSKKCA